MAQVTIAGLGSTTVNVDGLQGDTVHQVLGAALDALGAPADAANGLSAVVDGEDADAEDSVTDDSTVTAGPRVQNG